MRLSARKLKMQGMSVSKLKMIVNRILICEKFKGIMTSIPSDEGIYIYENKGVGFSVLYITKEEKQFWSSWSEFTPRGFIPIIMSPIQQQTTHLSGMYCVYFIWLLHQPFPESYLWNLNDKTLLKRLEHLFKIKII